MDRKKIVLIGPVYPYKGGIAQYTGSMCRALSKKYQVEMISYSMQYPKFLFKKEQKDYSNKECEIPGTKYWIHTANPFNWIRSAKRIKKLQPDLVIIQWWHPYFSPCYWTMMKMLRKFPMLVVCHNVFPHERFPMDRKLTKMVLKQGNRFLVHSGMDESDLKTILDNPCYRRTVLPVTNDFKTSPITKEEARKKLGLGNQEKVLLFFGFVREYKGLKHLLDAMPKIVETYPDTKLLIVGDFGQDKEDYLEKIKNHKLENFVSIHEGYIPDREVGKYFAACDLVVLPYESATQSGIVPIAYDFEKPVVVTNVGGLPDVVKDQETGFIVESKRPDLIAKAVIDFYKSHKEEEFVANVRKEAYRFSWERMVEVIESFED